MSDAPAKPRRRWLRFSLRTLLILMAFIGIWLGIEKSRVLKQDRIAARVRDLGGDVFLGYRFDPSGKPKGFSKRKVPTWIVNLIGEDYFLTIVTVNFDNDFGNRPSDRTKAHASQVTDEDLALLNDTPNVTELLLDGNYQLTDDCLAHAAGLKHLRVLTLRQTRVTGPGLANIRSLQKLEGLILIDTPLTDEGLMYLKDLPKLEWLLMNQTAISDEGLSYLASLKSLRRLDLRDTKVTDQGLKHFRNMKSLRTLLLPESSVTNEGRAELQRSLPKCRISLQ